MSQSDKILIAIYELLKENDFTRYEDVVVKSFKMFPESFALKSYEKYPDTNAVNKVIYTTLKPDGYLFIKNLKIYLTEFGKEHVEHLTSVKTANHKSKASSGKIEKKEITRLVGLKGFQHFIKNPEKELLDIDCYEFYGITARTSTKDMKNRKRQFELRMKEILKLQSPELEELKTYKSKIDIELQRILDEHNSAKN